MADEEQKNPAETEAPPETETDVREVVVDGKTFLLVGTAHISRVSQELVRRVIERERPDRVCVELDERRYQSLLDPSRWQNLNLKEVIKKKQLSTLIVQLVLASYQKRLGAQLGTLPGMELLEATRTAEELGIPYDLCDRDVSITLKRAWRTTPWTKKWWLFASLLASLFERPELDEKKLEEIRKHDVLTELLNELGDAFPSFKKVLIDERDIFLATRLKEAKGKRIVAVVGAGHVEGMRQHLEATEPADLKALEELPPASKTWKYIGIAIPLLIIGSLVWIGIDKGAAAAGANLRYWILANGIPSALGALLAFAHPLTIAAAFVAAPITSLTPVIGAGYVTAFLQALLRPPRVYELQNVADDMGQWRNWWRNRLLRIFLAFLLPSLGSVIGTWVGGVEIIKNLF